MTSGAFCDDTTCSKSEQSVSVEPLMSKIAGTGEAWTIFAGISRLRRNC